MAKIEVRKVGVKPANSVAPVKPVTGAAPVKPANSAAPVKPAQEDTGYQSYQDTGAYQGYQNNSGYQGYQEKPVSRVEESRPRRRAQVAEDPHSREVYEKGTSLMRIARTEDEYLSAAVMFDSIPGYRDSDIVADKCRQHADNAKKDEAYAQASELMKLGSQGRSATAVKALEQALDLFNSIPGWRDADERLSECRRKLEEIRLVAETSKKKTTKTAVTATVAFLLCAAVFLFVTRSLIPGSNYNRGMAALEAGDYANAAAVFEALGDYNDSEARLLQAENALYNIDIDAVKSELKAANVGDYLKLGYYEQDNDLTNGKEPVEWLVLAKEDSRMLLVSKYCLEGRPYNTSPASVTWESCSLRKWMNDTLYYKLFAGSTKDVVLLSHLGNSDNPQYLISGGNETDDRVFLLSYKEAEEYFVNNPEAMVAVATEYAKALGAYYTANDSCWWWLRSPGYFTNNAVYVYSNGGIISGGKAVHYHNNGIRPAVWVGIN